MKIECSKQEWAYLKEVLLKSHNSFESYNYPGFLASFISYDGHCTDIKIEGEFIEEKTE